MWAGPRRSSAPNFLATNGGLPLPSPQKVSTSSSFSAAFPTLLLLASFIVLWDSISAMAGNARAQLGHKEVGWREVRTGRVRGDPLWPRKGR